MEPYTYDITFCISKCNNKCERHIDRYTFEPGRLISQADFNCKENKNDRSTKFKNSNK
jgi:hypothetical protein